MGMIIALPTKFTSCEYAHINILKCNVHESMLLLFSVLKYLLI